MEIKHFSKIQAASICAKVCAISKDAGRMRVKRALDSGKLSAIDAASEPRIERQRLASWLELTSVELSLYAGEPVAAALPSAPAWASEFAFQLEPVAPGAFRGFSESLEK